MRVLFIALLCFSSVLAHAWFESKVGFTDAKAVCITQKDMAVDIDKRLDTELLAALKVLDGPEEQPLAGALKWVKMDISKSPLARP